MQLLEILHIEGYTNCIIGSRFTAILLNDLYFAFLVELHWEGSAPAACTASLVFYQTIY